MAIIGGLSGMACLGSLGLTGCDYRRAHEAPYVAPVVVAPPVVYAAPQPVYEAPPPVYVEPQPVYVEPQPVFVGPEIDLPIVVGGDGHDDHRDDGRGDNRAPDAHAPDNHAPDPHAPDDRGH